MRTLSTLLLVLSSFMLSYAQNPALKTDTPRKETNKHNGLELGLLAGSMVYTGDTHCEDFLFKQKSLSYGAFARYYLSDNFSARLNLIAGKIKGDDRNYPDAAHGNRNFSFTSNLFDINAALEWEPLGKRRYREMNNFKKIVSPYLSIGAGFVNGKPKVNYNEANNTGIAAQIALDKANTKKSFFNVPFGGGVRYDISRRLTLGAEAFFRVPFTDYLDGVSKSANPNERDWYYTGMLNLGYKLAYNRDSDNDGVVDSEDVCPTIAGLATAKGCPDQDRDGVIDTQDSCPTEKGPISLSGCPDRDADGIPDKDDTCPDAAGDAAYSGCPDRDGDGIIDSKDECPDTKGSRLLNGCADTDGDGISDKYDACPNERGPKSESGCPVKIVEKVAEKVIVAAPVATKTTTQTTVVRNDGMEISPDAVVIGTFVDNSSVVKSSGDVIQRTDRVVMGTGNEVISANAVFTGDINSGSVTSSSTTITFDETAVFEEALYGIEFETGSAIIKTSSYGILNRVFGVMERKSSFNFEISGHTDNTGNAEANTRLSQARANAVLSYLTKKGIATSRLDARGYGSSNPVADNGFAAGRAKNRRVQFNIR